MLLFWCVSMTGSWTIERASSISRLSTAPIVSQLGIAERSITGRYAVDTATLICIILVILLARRSAESSGKRIW